MNLAGKLLLVADDKVPLVGQVRPVVNELTRIVVRRTVAVTAMSEAIIPGKLKKCGEQCTFGLSNAPATFERLMERVLQELPWTVCLIYLDDVIVHARTLANQFSNLQTVFQRL